jgi:signal transduction histidine kinase
MKSWAMAAGGAGGRVGGTGMQVVAALQRLLLCLALESPPWALAATPNVLVIYSNSRLLPANIDVDRGLNDAPGEAEGGRPRLFTEFLGTPEFDGDAYRSQTAAYLRSKYAALPPRILIAGGAEALRFALRHRDQMFPGVPIVHVGVDRAQLQSLRLPADVVGIPVHYDFRGTIALALVLHPQARQLVVVTGASRWDLEREAEVRDALAALRPALPAEHLTGLSSAEVKARLAALDGDAVVFTPGYFRDGAGGTFTPQESVLAMVMASTAPLYVPYASQIGTGAVGGRMASYVEMGRATRAIVNRLLAGEPVTSIAVPVGLPALAHVDWRAIRRWRVADERVPSDAVVHFREPDFWATYRKTVMAAVAVVLAQAGLIAALLFERRRRRRAAAALAASEQRIGLAAQAARLSTFVWKLTPDQDGSGDERQRRAEPDQALPASLAEALQAAHPADRERLEVAVRDATANHTELDTEYRQLQPDGTVRWLAVRGRTAVGEPGHLTGVFMDISARKNAELRADADRAALTHLSRVSTMGQLSAAIAHQLNQPLAAILGNAEAARRMLDRADMSVQEIRDILDDIVAEDHRAAEIIRRLRALYRRGEIEPSRLDLNDLVRETLDLLRAELVARQVTPAVELDPSRPTVLGNAVQLQQVLLNLVLNAADAMQGVEASRRRVIIRTRGWPDGVELCVVDRGTGLSAENMQRVFEPFWTTKAEGLGLGLAICHAIVTAHHGTLAVTDHADGGAVFCATLPPAPG